MNDYILQMKDIVKEFSSQRVLNNVTLNIKKGEIHGLCGENGAGKSTLMKILSGAYPYGDYEGEIIIDGEPKRFHGPKESADAGIEIIYQELEIAPNLTVAENVFLGHEPRKKGLIDSSRIIGETQKIINRLKIDISPMELVENLGVGMKQMVAIAKSLSRNPKVLILDEPSAALSDAETDILLDIIKELSASGVSCVYISHRLNEVMQVADNITVLRDGNTICTTRKEDTNQLDLIRNMVGRELSDQFIKKGCEIGDIIFEVKNLSVVDHTTGKQILDNISFDVRKGEIVGLAGLMGAGRTEVAMAIMGVLPGEREGEINIEGRALDNSTPARAIRNGVSIVVEDRKEKGLVLDMDIKNNVVLSSLKRLGKWGVLNQNELIKCTKDYCQKLDIKARSIEMEVGRLSGGNQQKVVLAKALMTIPKVLILDEPTRGIDVGAKHEIYMIMNDLVKQGVSIIMISSELPEVLAMADRIVVMNQGKITGVLNNNEANQELIMHYATMEG
jgi:D-xylose transport system ATP-binding protein